jgi:outer membrane receptor protein involved in Fe transport
MIKPLSSAALIRRSVFVSSALLAVLVSVRAQTVPAAATTAVQKEELIQLSPFVVSTANDSGYRSQQTLVGTRSVKNLADIPGNISIINSEMIADLSATNLSELVKVGSAGIGQNQTVWDDYNIRGFRSSFSLRDGVTKTSYRRNPMYDIERVEVLKGPIALTLGNNSFIGGAINMVTRPATARRQGDAQLTISDRNYFRLAVNQTGPIYQDSDFKANYRVTVGAEKGDREKEVEHDDQKFVGGQVQLLFGDRTIVTINGSIFKDDGLRFYNDFSEVASATAAQPYARIHRFSGGATAYSLRKHNWQKADELFVSATALTRLTANSSLRTFFHYIDYQDRRREIITAGLAADNRTLSRLQRPLSIDNTIALGQVDYIHELERESYRNTFMAGAETSRSYNWDRRRPISIQALDVGTAKRDFSWDEANLGTMPSFEGPNLASLVGRSLPFSWYVQDNLSFFKGKLSLVAGSRFFRSYNTNLNRVTGVMTESPIKHFRGDKYAILFKPLPYLTVYAGNTTTILPQSGFTTEEIPQPFRDQEGSNKEAGIKLDHRLSNKVAVFGSVTRFDMAITNVRTLTGQLNSRNEGIVIQSAQDSSKGWEFDAGASLGTDGGRLDLIANYYSADSFSAVNKGPAAQAVPHSYGGLAKYTWTGGALKGFDFGASLYRQGEIRGNAAAVRQMVPAYPVTYNLFAAYQWGKRWTLRLNWDNVTDERYIITLARPDLLLLNDPGRARLTVKYAW